MAANSNAKLKLLHIQRMLQEETDEEHGLSMRDIIERLNEQGIDAERKGVYRDIELLRQMGHDIRTYQRNPVEYALAQRTFRLEELMLIADAVASCKFLTKRQSTALIAQVKLLASENQRELLEKRIHVHGRITSKKACVFDNVDTIHQAMREKRKLSFLYVRLNDKGEELCQHDGLPYVLTPVKVIFDNSFYYLRAWSDHHEAAANYRIDRMRAVHLVDEPATRNGQITAQRQDESGSEFFGSFDGERVRPVLSVPKDRVEILFDRFGADLSLTASDDPERVNAHVLVRKSPAFFGWVAGLNNVVRIAGPESLAAEYRAYLQGLLDA